MNRQQEESKGLLVNLCRDAKEKNKTKNQNETGNTIMTTKDPITLRPLRGEDIPLFSQWLNKDYIYKRLCPDGEHQREAWMDEVCNKDGKYGFLTHFIVYYGDKKIGYCLYADCFFLKDHQEEGHDFEGLYGEVPEPNHTYEIGYLIGEEEYLNRGVSKIVIRQLEERIRELGGREIAADPSEENVFSVKALLSNGFTKRGDGDYRKKFNVFWCGDMNIKFQKIENDYPYNLLLQADETREGIEQYLFDSEVYVTRIAGRKEPVGVMCLLRINAETVELMNIAVDEPYRGEGIGGVMIEEAVRIAATEGCREMILGTGTEDFAPDQTRFYERHGFRKSHLRENYFVEKYPDQYIIENGIQLKDMQVFKRNLPSSTHGLRQCEK